MRRLILLPFLSAFAACAAMPPVPQPIPVFFRNASVALGPEAHQQVASAAAIAQQYPQLRISLVGYGLPTGMPNEPARLSAGRAAAVRDELVRDGVAPNRIAENAGGALTPPTDTSVESRRVDVSFTR